MDYSFGNAHVEVEKNFTKNEQVKATVKAVAEKIKEKEEKDNGEVYELAVGRLCRKGTC